MKMNKKIAFAIISSLILVSFAATFPASVGDQMQYPITTSSLDSSAEESIPDAFKSLFGHTVDEKYWSIIFDFAGNKLMKDYNPGPYAGDLNNGTTDSDNTTDANFYMAWNNLKNVDSFYFALQNYSWSEAEDYYYGTSPFQYFLQHFRIPTTNTHVFTLNKFLGLLAYQDDPTGIDTVPDENDSLYIGWPQYGEFHKFIVNYIFNITGVDSKYWIDNTTVGTAEPIPMEYNETEDSYTFGMSYQNIFVLWQKLSIEEGLGGSTGDPSVMFSEIVNNCSAFGMFSSINFTFTITKEDVGGGYTRVNTTTDYDIGKLDSLWIMDDDDTIANHFGGESFNITIPEESIDLDIGYYNETPGIQDRLDGNSTNPGFGLAVINAANVAVVKMTSIFFGLLEIPDPDASGLANFTDEFGNPLGEVSANITQASYNSSGDQVYTIDFASKPTYEWDNGSGPITYDAPTRVLNNDIVKTNITGIFDASALLITSIFIIASANNPLTGFLTGLEVIEQFLTNRFFYLTCFPRWSGATINQDPTFSVFVPPSTPSIPLGLGGDSGGGGGFPILIVVFAVGIVAVAGIGVIIWKKRR
jgi:hypothetical protein